MNEPQKNYNGISGIFRESGFAFFLGIFFFGLLSWPYASFLNSMTARSAIIYFFVVWVVLILLLLMLAFFNKKR